MAVRIPLFLLCVFLLCETLSAEEAAPKKEVKVKKDKIMEKTSEGGINLDDIAKVLGAK